MFDWLAPFVGAMMIVFGCFSFLVAREDAEANSLLVGEGRVLYSTASITLGKDGMHYYGWFGLWGVMLFGILPLGKIDMVEIGRWYHREGVALLLPPIL